MDDNQKKWLALAAGLSLLVLGFFGLGQYSGQRSALTVAAPLAGSVADVFIRQFLRTWTVGPNSPASVGEPKVSSSGCRDLKCFLEWQEYDRRYNDFLGDLQEWYNYDKAMTQYWKDLAAWERKAKACGIGLGIVGGAGAIVPGLGLAAEFIRFCAATPPPTPPTRPPGPFPAPPTPPRCPRSAPSGDGLPLCEDEGDTGTVGPGPIGT